MDVMTARILVVDDEEPIADLVATTLRYEGFDVATAASGSEALAKARTFRPDAVVLDVMLGDLDGYEVLRRMGDGGRTVPTLFLTARDTPEDRVRGLTLGADDYIGKPFSLAELVARVRAVLRRADPGAGARPATLTFADLTLDTEAFHAERGGTRIELTPTEYRLLHYLMLNPRRVLTKAQIVDHVWQYDFGGDMNVVETYVSYVRKKVDRLGEPLIHTVRGFGYVLKHAGE